MYRAEGLAGEDGPSLWLLSRVSSSDLAALHAVSASHLSITQRSGVRHDRKTAFWT